MFKSIIRLFAALIVVKFFGVKEEKSMLYNSYSIEVGILVRFAKSK